MKAVKMSGLGAEPKKVITLLALLALAAFSYFYFSSDSGGGSNTTSVSKPGGPVSADAPVPLQRVSRTSARRRGGVGGSIGEFHPSLKIDKDVDLTSVDPTLHLDLLERLKKVKQEAGSRSLFETGAVQTAAAATNIKEPPKIALAPKLPIGPQPPPPPAPKVEPAPPPIPLKFYGFISPRQATVGPKRAFFLDGDDIVVGAEGQLIKNRYRVVRIGVNSAVVEDTQFKNHQQTLPLVEETQG